jgi:methylase of polypeptide subunit release factors
MILANLPYLPAAAAPEHPELSEDPFESVFAPGDGLDAYRRLVGAAQEWLAEDGELLLQLHRHVFAATRAELPALGAALDGWPSGVALPRRPGGPDTSSLVPNRACRFAEG